MLHHTLAYTDKLNSKPFIEFMLQYERGIIYQQKDVPEA